MTRKPLSRSKGKGHHAALLTAVLARQTAAAVGVRACWPWETTATLPSARQRKAFRCPRGCKRGAGAYRGGRALTACLVCVVHTNCIICLVLNVLGLTMLSGMDVSYYAALLPRRGPHIASHSVRPSVCLSVRPVSGSSFVIVYITTRHLAPPSELQ